MMNERRALFKTLGAAGFAVGTWGSGALRTLAALGLCSGTSAAWAQTSARPVANRSPAFEAETPGDALRQLIGNAPMTEVGEQQIQLQVPELAENGAMVPVSVISLIPGTRQIMLLIEKNPHPLAASFYFPEGTEPGFQTRVKMAQSSRLRVVVQASQGQDLRNYTTVKETRVTLGGCGS
ncbi:twin-arginine translocation pathway signal protein [Hylemonella gracilis str. Niagara R]|uniref:Twin-arginine translocation pathway signal protein n=1 Tax=Hylemonella gracilis str. Niagara R TaxID=1458275 RepID=A0A016XJ02_9BURK|nr:thiosulfate oxidation carrier protein SoxY [Hylemonella gracilis]EYC51198.1 twin-arginine translocation pathway signal protein [Hylemonella gracilis str. Niagara R]